ncbi:MAG: tRNA (N(6)-L-threonylcarbamoyladenosine(37)-C(2))-methylthiotransferase MtaB [Oscillospiraceae bacterium]
MYLYSFGCKVNSYETEAMASALVKSDFVISDDMEDADAIVVNSCTVTAKGDKRVRQFIHKVKRDNPNATLVLTGCFPQAFPELAKEISEADIIMGTGNRLSLPGLLLQYEQTHKRIVLIEDNKAKAFEPLTVDIHRSHTRAFMKIEDGCDRYCSYCIIPFARGPVRSMSLSAIAQQAKVLAANGYRELVLSGINLSYCGREEGYNLADAVDVISDIDDFLRIRLGSLEPDLLDVDLLRRLSCNKKLCAQFHLALQSGCDRTLFRMNRHYTTLEYMQTAEKIRSLFSHPTFTTDIMVGFPGETEEDFAESVSFVESFGFARCHVFPYSVRPGTAASLLPGRLDSSIKDRRAAEMADAAVQAGKRVMETYVGCTARVILEQPHEDGSFAGYTDRYLPARVYGGNLATNCAISGTISKIENGHAIIVNACKQ